MQLFHRFCAALAMLTAAACATPAAAAFDKEHHWEVEAVGAACMASLKVPDGREIMLRAVDGGLVFAVGTPKPMAQGKKGVLQTEAYSFEFAPSYSKSGAVVFLDDTLNARAVAALRLANRIRVAVDDKTIVEVEGVAVEGALDAVTACSKGEAGWWGSGAKVQRTADAAPPAPAPEPVLNKEGLWSLSVLDGGTGCGAVANIDEHTRLMLLAAAGRVGLAVQSDAPLPQGKKGRVETGAYKFDFVPGYGGPRYFASEQPFDSQALFALRRADGVRVSVDGKLVLEASFEGSGLPELITSLIDCSKGEKGWWGDGAPQS